MSDRMSLLPPNRIEELRKARGLSQAKLGARCVPPYTATQIDKREDGRTAVTVDDLHRIARALDCHPAELLPLPQLSREEHAVIHLYREISETDRTAVFRVIDAMAKSRNDPSAPQRPNRRARSGAV